MSKIKLRYSGALFLFFEICLTFTNAKQTRMKKLFPVVLALLSGFILYTSCNKGDDNPYGDWKCTCFVAKNVTIITGTDTVKTVAKDTVYLTPYDMDKNTATSFCEQAAKGYKDTLGTTATCTLK
jgi:hypothetical protein